MVEEKIKHFVRVCSTDLMGKLPIVMALQKIDGVSHSFAHAVCSSLNLNKRAVTGTLEDDKIKAIQDLIEKPTGKIPDFLFNRQRDLLTGENVHISSTKLRLVKDSDIKRLRRLKSYRGMRHSYNLPVRGQRTRSNFRRGKTVGVQKKKIKGKKG